MSKPAITVAALLLLGVPTCAGYERELTKIRPEKEGKFEKIMDPADLLRTAGIEIQATSGSKSGSSSSGKSSGSKSGTGKSSKSSGSKSGTGKSSKSSGSKSGTGKSSKSSGSTGKSSKSSGSTGKSSKSSGSTGKSSKGSGSTGKSSKGSGKGSKGSGSTGKSSKGSGKGSKSGKSTGKSASEQGTSSPSVSPSPTESPTASPTKSPTASPSVSPTKSPTAPPVASSDFPSAVPSDFPSAVPSVSVAPTIPCNMDEETRRQMIFNILTVDNDVTPAAEINDVGSSANLAFEWLVGEDALYLCPDEPKIIQRYVLAKIYFQSNGDDWLQCSRPGNVCAPGSSDFGPLGGEDWLSPVNECDWAFLRCNNDNCITHIEVGKYI